MRRTGKKYRQKAHRNGIGWHKIVQRERYMRSVQDQESVGLLFGLRTSSAWFLEDKKRCRVVSDERCVMCDSGVGGGCDSFPGGLWGI